MRKFFVLLATCLALLVGFGTAAPAQAEGDFPLPPSMSSYKFGYTHICVNNGDNTLPISQSTSWWNTAVDNSPLDQGLSLQIQYSNNCTNLGYAANRQFTVDTYSAADGTCGKITNGSTTTNNGYRVWSGNPHFLINSYPSYYCLANAQRRAHYTSTMIGWAIGFKILTTSGWASRVMCTCSSDTIQGPSVKEGDEAAGLYRGFYTGLY